jgi:hypothetical protein
MAPKECLVEVDFAATFQHARHGSQVVANFWMNVTLLPMASLRNHEMKLTLGNYWANSTAHVVEDLMGDSRNASQLTIVSRNLDRALSTISKSFSLVDIRVCRHPCRADQAAGISLVFARVLKKESQREAVQVGSRRHQPQSPSLLGPEQREAQPQGSSTTHPSICRRHNSTMMSVWGQYFAGYRL